jgi:FkbM family methyltransferase
MAKLRELKYELIGTPLEPWITGVRRYYAGYVGLARHPELREIYREDGRIHALWKKIVRPNSNCIDVGCHYGSVLSQFCRLAPSGMHLAVEAIPEKAAFLRRKFPQVDVRNLALCDYAGTSTFHIDVDKSGFSGLGRHTEGKFRTIEVKCDSLDSIVPRDRRFDILKLDVEGAELLVLRGATGFLRSDRPTILFECGPSGPEAFHYTAADLHRFLISQDYLVFFVKDALHGGAPIDSNEMEEALRFPFKAFNWAAIPKERSSDGRN